MPKFKQRPIEVEAVQFTEVDMFGTPWFKTFIPDWLNSKLKTKQICVQGGCLWFYGVRGGVRTIGPNDWVVRKDEETFDVLSPEQFHYQYEAVSS